MFGFNRNRVGYEYCELIESDLDKLYQKAEHLKSIGYEMEIQKKRMMIL